MCGHSAIVTVLVLVVGSRTTVHAQLEAGAPWPQFRGNSRGTGLNRYVGAQTVVLKWSYATGGAVFSSPAIGADGTVYVGSADNMTYAFDGATGALKWN